MAAKSGVESVLKSLIDNLFAALENIKEKEREKDELHVYNGAEDFKLKDFWNCLGPVVFSVSKETTNVSVMFSKPPLPSAEECQGLVTRLQTAVLTLLSFFCQLPRSQGQTLHKSVRLAVYLVVEGVIVLLQNVCSISSDKKLQTTGTVWEHCDAFGQLPKDNITAVVACMTSSMGLIQDALSEIEEFQTSPGSDENSTCLSTKETMLLSPCVGLIKASRIVLKKVCSCIKAHGNHTNVEHIKEMDRMENITQKISPCVDDVVLNFYELPISTEKLLEEANKLADCLKEILDNARCCHFCPDSDSSWVDFLHKAVEHNLDKLSTASSSQQEVTGNPETA